MALIRVNVLFLAILAVVAGLPAVSLAQNKLLTIDDIYDLSLIHI